ncbi:MAG: ABC transporter ATP-binding protein [Tissierellia bacterium]|nr:ABC transporter ATP-binding protein [Tissierellia bacterium]
MKKIRYYYQLIEGGAWSLILSLILLVASSMISLMIPKRVGSMVDAMKNGTLSQGEFYPSLGVILLLVFLSYLMACLWGYLIFRNYYYGERKIRMSICKTILEQNPRFFLKHQPGTIISKATSDSTAVSEALGYGIMVFFDGVIYPAMILYQMIKIHPVLAFLALVSIPLNFLLILRISKRHDEIYEAGQESFDALHRQSLESVGGVKIIKAFGVEHIHKKIFLRGAQEKNQRDMSLTKLQSFYAPASELYYGIFSILSFVIGAYFIGKGSLTMGQLVTYAFYLINLQWPAKALSELLIVGKEAHTSRKRIEEIFIDGTVSSQEGAIIEDFASIEFKDFSFAYPCHEEKETPTKAPDPTFVLRHLNLQIRKGEKVAIVGRTGSGKTTLLRQLLCTYPEVEGSLTINQIPVQNLDKTQWRHHLAYVPQEHFLFSKTVKDNIIFFREENEEELEFSMKAADFSKDLPSLPLGIHSTCGEMGIILSGGQKQRLSLARAFYETRDIFIFDDVLSAVDTKTEQKILSNLQRYFPEKTMVYSSHRLSAVVNADKILVLDKGEIVEMGTFDELMEQGGWFAQEYKAQSMQEVSHDNRTEK